MRKVFGVGINDSGYTTQTQNPTWICPFYSRWKAMLNRCYYNYRRNQIPYADAYVCESWLYFSNFKKWMESQDWIGRDLDKDILIEGNKVYSPETCCFVPKNINAMLTDGLSMRGDFMIGVSFSKEKGKFQSYIRDMKQLHLGFFETELEAHKAWCLAKSDVIHRRLNLWRLAEPLRDTRVSEALLRKAWDLRLRASELKP